MIYLKHIVRSFNHFGRESSIVTKEEGKREPFSELFKYSCEVGWLMDVDKPHHLVIAQDLRPSLCPTPELDSNFVAISVDSLIGRAKWRLI